MPCSREGPRASPTASILGPGRPSKTSSVVPGHNSAMILLRGIFDECRLGKWLHGMWVAATLSVIETELTLIWTLHELLLVSLVRRLDAQLP